MPPHTQPHPPATAPTASQAERAPAGTSPPVPSNAGAEQRRALAALVQAQPRFMAWLRAARSLGLQHWCIGAGAVRNLVWDHLHGHTTPSALADVDLAFFDPHPPTADHDAQLQAQLQHLQPECPWEVTNQALVHTWFEAHFGHAVPALPSLEAAVASWPEYATAVGVWLDGAGRVQVIAPHGLDDLWGQRVRRNPARVSLATYQHRVRSKRYTERWPRVVVEAGLPEG
jgi:hypothetical protein